MSAVACISEHDVRLGQTKDGSEDGDAGCGSGSSEDEGVGRHDRLLLLMGQSGGVAKVARAACSDSGAGVWQWAFGDEEEWVEEDCWRESAWALEAGTKPDVGEADVGLSVIEEEPQRESCLTDMASKAKASAVDRSKTRVKQRTWRMDRHQRRRLQASARAKKDAVASVGDEVEVVLSESLVLADPGKTGESTHDVGCDCA